MTQITSKAFFGRRSLFLVMLTFVIAVASSWHLTHATPTVSSTSWTGTPLPGSLLYAHDNGTVTSSREDACSYASPNAIDTVTRTEEPATYSMNNQTSGWYIPSCSQLKETGQGNTFYYVEYSTSSNAKRIVAKDKNTILWTYTFPASGCRPNSIKDLALGYDGNLYASIELPAACGTPSNTLRLISIENGTKKSEITLPSNISATATGTVDEIMPYEDGIAVLNNGANIYHYSYGGVQDASRTFSPSLSGGVASVQHVSTSPTGRTYMIAYTPTTTKVLYKETTSSTIHEIVPSVGASKALKVYAAPNNNTVIHWLNSSQNGISYFDNSDAETFSVNLQYDGSESLISTHPGIIVNDLGEVIVSRTMMSGSQRISYIDLFDSSGSKTRVFNSDIEFGTSASDQFATTAISQQSFANGKLYFALCNTTTYLSTAYCRNADNPILVTLALNATSSYYRTALIDSLNEKLDYAALGDSYSSGEGLPPFIEPSGSNNCDRTSYAFSGQLTNPSLSTYNESLNLTVFRACSGATTAEIFIGKNGETGQISSLSNQTDIVTITAGGNDIGFSDLAAECVLGTCDAASSQYLNASDQIDNYLQSSFELLLDRIRNAAPNAAIYVLGYPNVVPTGTACTAVFSTGEAIAVNSIITSLNTKLYSAVVNSGSGIVFLDPTASGSPFIGHELCTQDPFFFGLNIAEHRFSFHPNSEGQAAYAQMVNNELAI